MAADEALSSEQFRKLPNYAMFRGRRVRVASYEGNNRFTVLDGERKVFTHRDNLTFVKNPKRST